MAFGRDTDGIVQEKWASAAGAEVSLPSLFSLMETMGFPSSWSQSGGQPLPRRLWNFFFRRFTAFAIDQSTHGILHWNSTVRYSHPAFAVGSDARIYRSIQDSLNVDPVADTDFSHWKPLIGTADGTVGDSGGALTADEIPGLDASKTVSGVFAIARIPNIAASMITSGVFPLSRLPVSLMSFAATQVTSGVFAAARIPGLAASKITSGVFALARIPDLPASKTTTGTFASARLPLATSTARGAVKVRTLTEAQYDALTTKDAETQYYFTS